MFAVFCFCIKSIFKRYNGLMRLFLSLFVCLGVLVGKIHKSEDCLDSWWRQVGDSVVICFLLLSVCLSFPVNVWFLFFYRMEDQFAALHENPDMWVLLFQCFPHKVLLFSICAPVYLWSLDLCTPQNYRHPRSSHARHQGHESEAARRGIRGVRWGWQVRN